MFMNICLVFVIDFHVLDGFEDCRLEKVPSYLLEQVDIYSYYYLLLKWLQ